MGAEEGKKGMRADKRRVVDARGLACPQPVILTRRELLDSQPGERVTVMVDNAAARENVLKLAASMGARAQAEERDGFWLISIQKAQEEQESLREAAGAAPGRMAAVVLQPAERNRGEEPTEEGQKFPDAEKLPGRSPRVILITAPTLGRENQELGAVLMKSFLYTLGEAENAPCYLIFLNEAVRLACEGSPVLEILQRLTAKGTKIFACGTCLDYLGLKEKLTVGEITNMYAVVDLLCSGEGALIL